MHFHLLEEQSYLIRRLLLYAGGHVFLIFGQKTPGDFCFNPGKIAP